LRALFPLVVGATGGVGTTVIPLLAAAEARVIATARAADAGALRDLGADETIGCEQAARGELTATIGRRYSLGEGVQACTDFVRLHTTGKLVVTM
jgi:NADPH:quinone reductase-like Zn-dependent oxidoreductase